MRVIAFVCRQTIAFLMLAFAAAAQTPSFATLTIQPARSDARIARVQVLPNGDVTATSVPVIQLLSYAYDLPANPTPRLSTVPEWMARERFDIDAIGPTDAVPVQLPASEKRRHAQRLIRGILADGFRLALRVESKTMPIYALSVAPGGAKLQKSAIDESDCGFALDAGGCRQFEGGLGHPLNAKAVDMDDLVRYIENWTDLPVVNRTSLGGLYSVKTEGWVPMRLPPPPPNAAPSGNPFAGLPSLFTVLGKLGLELKRQEGVVPIYTVERAERPAAR